MDILFQNKNKEEYHTDLITESLRLNFAKKVYGIVSIQLLATTALTFISMTNKDFLQFQEKHGFFLIIALILPIIIQLVVIFKRQIAREVPTNYIMLGIFTFCQAYTISFSCALVDPQIIFSAALLTLAITCGLTVYAFTTKKDFTVMGGLVFCAFFALFPILFFSFFIKTTFTMIVYELIGVLLAAFYLIYDTQLIMGGKRLEIGIDDYILASFVLYQDIIVLFLKIVKILIELQEDKDKKKK